MRPIREDRSIPLIVMMVSVGLPLVSFGGGSLHELREDVYDAARASNFRGALLTDIDSTYMSAMMGGVPYDVWNDFRS